MILERTLKPYRHGSEDHALGTKRALRLAQFIGAPVTTKALQRGGWLFDGKVIHAGGLSPSDFLHEVAHWQLASPSRRIVPEFGLGISPDPRSGPVGKNNILVQGIESDIEEARASALGICYLYHLGLEIQETLDDHGWLDEGDIHGCFSWLIENGYVTTTLEPTGKLYCSAAPHSLEQD